MARNGNAKGGLDGGFLETFGIEYNTRALLIDARWTTAPNVQTTPTVMPYAFPKQVSDYTAVPNYPNQNLLVGFAELAPEQKLAVRTSLDLVSSFTKLTFTESSSGHWATARSRRTARFPASISCSPTRSTRRRAPLSISARRATASASASS